MEETKRKSIIVCDECGAEFEAQSIEFKHTKTLIDGKNFNDIVYYKCPTCEKIYVVCMLDHYGKKLQDKYIAALESYRAAHAKHVSENRLRQKLQKVETLKAEAMSYQHEVLHKYRDLLPGEIFS